jgi:hypothetical protein
VLNIGQESCSEQSKSDVHEDVLPLAVDICSDLVTRHEAVKILVKPDHFLHRTGSCP